MASIARKAGVQAVANVFERYGCEQDSTGSQWHAASGGGGETGREPSELDVNPSELELDVNRMNQP